MSVADKRAVATDALEVLGTIITGKGVGRDAIHLAVEPAVAGCRLLSRQDVCRWEDGRYGVARSAADKCVGIVDPFLEVPVKENDEFLLVVYPRTITSLRHVWSHPDFPEQCPVTSGQWPKESENEESAPDAMRVDSERWLRAFADEHGEMYDAMMLWANRYQETGEQEVGGYDWMNFESPPEFWSHWSVVTGRTAKRGGDFWTCEC